MNDTISVVKYERIKKIITVRIKTKNFRLISLSDRIREYTNITEVNVTKALNK